MGRSNKAAAPAADPALGIAARESAALGRESLSFMKDQAKITNGWAQQDRNRYNTTFKPVEDRFVRDSVGYDTPDRRAAEAGRARGAVRTQAAGARDIMARSMASMGVNPASGRYAAGGRDMAMQETLATVGASNVAERAVETEGRSRMAQAVALGQGSAINPATSMGMGTAAVGGGFQTAISGVGQQASLLGAKYNADMQAYQADREARSQTMGGLGALAGTALSIFSDENVKTNKRPARGALRAVERMPVEAWRYKEGVEDGGQHVGTYAQDFKRETGLGDGRSIPVIDAIGVTMGAVKELSAKIDRMGPRGAVRRERKAA